MNTIQRATRNLNGTVDFEDFKVYANEDGDIMYEYYVDQLGIPTKDFYLMGIDGLEDFDEVVKRYFGC